MKLTLPALARFTGAEMLFSAKSFAAAMLAMYLASRAGLSRPFWALMTTYVVANPLAGAVRSKALYRFCGTLIGSTAALLMMPALVNAPVLLTLAMAAWLALCLYLSLLDRTPRAYVFMLAGYTAAFVGFPNVDTPQLMFETAVLRVEEIGLGILSAALVHSIFWPRALAPSVLGAIDRTLADGRRWLDTLLDTRPRAAAVDEAKLTADRRRLAGDITQLRLLSTHVPYDTTHLRWTAGAIRSMQDRVAALTPHLSAVEDRLKALADPQGALPGDVTALLSEVAAWLQQQGVVAESGQALSTKALRLRLRQFSSGTAPLDPQARWLHAVRIGLAQRLEELIDEWQACARLRRDIDAGLGGAASPLRRRQYLGNRVLHRDHGMALLSALSAALSVVVCCAFWVLTGWSYGYVAVMMAAVFCSFFAAMDDPVPAIHSFLKWTLWSVPLSALYVLVLLPVVRDFGMLVLICAPLFLLIGCYIARPANFGQAMPLFFGVASTLAMHDTANADLMSFVNFMAAEVLGVVIAARITRLMRSVGTQWSARRIQRTTWRELGEMAHAGPGVQTDPGYVVRMLDRIGLLAPRVAQSGGTIDGVLANDALRDLRVGADLATLQRHWQVVGLDVIQPVLGLVAEFFRRRSQGKAVEQSPFLLGRIDAAIDRLFDNRTGPAETAEPATGEAGGDSGRAAAQALAVRAAVAALVGLRRNLLPAAPARLVGQDAAAPLQLKDSP